MFAQQLIDRLKEPPFDKPIGIIGSKEEANEIINNFIKENDNVIHLNEDISVDDIKTFRKQLIKSTYSRNIGIIQRLDKFNPQKQAVLLKVFENLPSYCVVFYVASYLPSFTIQTRSEIYYLQNKIAINENMKLAMSFILNAMKNQSFDECISNSWKIFVKIQSLYFDGIISEDDKNAILNGLDVKFVS